MDCIVSVDLEDYRQTTLRAMGLPEADGKDQTERGLDRILQLFDELGLGAVTFFTTGQVARNHGNRISELVKAGHEIGCHTLNHDDIGHLGPEGFSEDLRRATEVLEDASGQSIVGFRAPNFSGGLDIAWFRHTLRSQGYLYDSSLASNARRTDTEMFDLIETDAGPIFEFPVYSTKLPGGVGVRVIGGTFLRLLPLQFIRQLMFKAVREGYTPVIYLHVADLDPHLPWITYGDMDGLPVGIRFAWLARQNLWNRGNAWVLRKVKTLLQEFRHLGPYGRLAGLTQKGGSF